MIHWSNYSGSGALQVCILICSTTLQVWGNDSEHSNNLPTFTQGEAEL